jgi:hypothetical protein
MKRRLGYKGYMIEARWHELRDGGFSTEFSIEEHDALGVTETQFYVPNTFAAGVLHRGKRFRPHGRRSMWVLSAGQSSSMDNP